jgi:hypothetical protein
MSKTSEEMALRLEGAAAEALARIAELRGCSVERAMERALGTQLTLAEEVAKGSKVIAEVPEFITIFGCQIRIGTARYAVDIKSTPSNLTPR